MKIAKIKELWNQISQEIKNIFFKYPVTMSVIIIWTLVCVIFVNQLSIDGIINDYILPFLGWFGVGVFFIESRFEKRFFKIFGMIIAAAVSAFLVYQYQGYYEKGNSYVPGDLWFARINLAYIAVCLLLGVYCCYRKSGYLLPQYGIRVFSNLVKIHIIQSILSAGALMVGIIIQELFFSNSFDLNIIMRMMILVMGLFYLPSCIYSFSEPGSKIDGFSKILVKYVLFPLTVLVFAIIYLYVIKILILRDIPSNQIFAILTGVFILSMPTWTMMESLEEEIFWYRISGKLPLLFVPFIALQMYSVGVRVSQYGITPDRYLGVIWIILEIIYFLIYFGMHRYVGRMTSIAAAAVIVALLLPGVNMYRISALSQANILSQYKIAQYKGNMEPTKEQKAEIYGAYEYLKDIQDSKKYIEDKYTAEEIKEIEGFYDQESNRYYNSNVHIETKSYPEDLNIEKYSTMQIVGYKMDYGEKEPDLGELNLVNMGSQDVIITLDLQEMIEKYLEYGLSHAEKDEYCVNIDSYYLENCRITLDEDRLLVISSFEMVYDKEAEEIEMLDLTAYLFQ